MALKLGELAAVIKTDDSEFEKGLDKAQGKFKGFGDKMKGSATAIGASAALALGVAMAGALDLGAAEAKLGAQLGATPADAKRYGEVAGRLYKDGFGESMAGLAETVRAVISGGLIDRNAATADIAAVARSAQTLADVLGVDVADAAAYASTLIGSGLAKDATHAFDLIMAASQKVPSALQDDVLEAGNEYGQFFRSLGFNGEQAFGLLAAASAKGEYGIDKTGDALKEFTLLATDMSTATTGAYKAIGLDAGKMSNDLLKGGDTAKAAFDKIVGGLLSIKDPTKQANTAIALFGTPLEDMNKADIPEFLANLGKVGSGLGDVEGSTKRAGDAMQDTASKKLEKFKRAVQTALVEKVSEAIPHLEKVGKWASENSGTLLTVGAVIAGIAVSVWAVNAAMAAWNAIQLVWTGITTAATAVQWLLNAALLANPIGLIVLAIVALVAGIWLLWENSAAFRDFWIMVWDAIWGAIVAVGRWFRDTLWPWMKDVWSKISGAAGKAKDWIVEKWDAMIGFFKGLPGKLKKAAAGLWDGIKNSFKSALNWIIGKWNNLSFRIPGISVPGLGQVWGGATLSTPDLPYMAGGGTIGSAGYAVVGERGRELVHMPAGASVQPNRYGGAGDGVQHIHLHAKFVMPGGREIREEVIDYAGQIGLSPANLWPATS